MRAATGLRQHPLKLGLITGILALSAPAAHVATSSPERVLASTTTPVASVGIVKESITFIDHSRPTPARGTVAAKPDRVLVTEIRRPARWTGRLGIVVFAHGWDSNPGVYEPLLDAWAEAGYFVAAPVLPSSSNLLPGTPVSDYAGQARDVSFVLTSVLRRFAKIIDPNRIAVAGHSDGGTDVALLALNPAYYDARARAFLSLSGEIPADIGGPWNATNRGSLLVTVGTEDQFGLYPLATKEFNQAAMTKVMIVVEGGDHLGPYVGSSPTSVALRAETVRFLNAALNPGPASVARLRAALLPAGSSQLHVVADAG